MLKDERLLRLKEHLDKTSGMLDDNTYVDAITIGRATLYEKDKSTEENEIILVYEYGDNGINYNELKELDEQTEFNRLLLSEGFNKAVFVNVYNMYDVADTEVSFKVLKGSSIKAYTLKYKTACNTEAIILYDCDIVVNKKSQEIISTDVINELFEMEV